MSPEELETYARIAWVELRDKGIWRQLPGQCTELTVEKIVSKHHLWEGEDALILGQEPTTVRLRTGEYAGRNRDDELVLIRDEGELLRYLEENLDETQDETYVPEGQPLEGEEEKQRGMKGKF